MSIINKILTLLWQLTVTCTRTPPQVVISKLNKVMQELRDAGLQQTFSLKWSLAPSIGTLFLWEASHTSFLLVKNWRPCPSSHVRTWATKGQLWWATCGWFMRLEQSMQYGRRAEAEEDTVEPPMNGSQCKTSDSYLFLGDTKGRVVSSPQIVWLQ